MIQEIKNFISQRKKTSVIIALAVVLIGYFAFKSLNNTSGQVRYALATVQKGTLITSISGSGQVSVSDQLDVKAKTSGDVIYTITTSKLGQTVNAGTLLVQLDTTDAQKVVRNAQISLDNAQINLAKLKSNQVLSIPNIQDSIATTTNSLNQDYTNGFNSVSGAFLDLPAIVTNLHDVLYATNVGSSGQINTGAYENLMDQYGLQDLLVMITGAQDAYNSAYTSYSQNLLDYNDTNMTSDTSKIESLMAETLKTTSDISQLAKNEQNILDVVVKSMSQFNPHQVVPAALTQYQTELTADIGKLNSDVNNLMSTQNSIINDKQNLASLNRNLTNAQTTNPLDLSSQENSVKQAQASLDDAKQALAYCYITAPFSGILAKVSVNKYDSASSGTAVATMITPQQIAQLSLNEVDAAKIKIGDKATLTFSAVPDLTVVGQVLEIDTIGTVSQGVVSYTVKIGFDTQDIKVKPGMSVSANIITDVKVDVLIVPNSAVKTVSGNSYVQVVNSSEVNASANGNAGIL